MKKILAFLLSAVLLFGIAIADDTYWVMCNPNSFVFVREFPKKNGKEAGYLYYGDEVVVDGQKRNGYWHIVDGISTESGDGWVKGLYLVDEKPEPAESTLYCVSSRGRVALRSGVNGRRIGWLKNGDTVRVYGKTSEWAVTKRGYVKIQYFDIEGE